MDKLARRLRDDADRIECTVSAELDERIRASLQGIKPEAGQRPRRERRSFSFWWASSVTGVAAALVLIVIVNLQVQAPNPVPAAVSTTPPPLVLPAIRWHAEAAVLTSPLEQEIEDLQSDLRKAEEAVKEDIDRLF
jgi:hypothetical protein